MSDATTFDSLASFASYDTSGVEGITTLLPDEGIFMLEGTEAGLSQSDPKEEGQQKLTRFAAQGKILMAFPTDKSIDPEKLVDRKLTWSETLWPDRIQDYIRLLIGNFQKIGIDTTGKMGGVEGAEPGWLDKIVGYQFAVKVTRFKRKDGTEGSRVSLISPEDFEAAYKEANQ